jgi:glycosyltransferase involved in cell wall biosynthesis
MPVKKVVIVTNIPNPYRIPLFNEVNRQCIEQGFQMKVLFGSEGYARRKFKLDLSECKFDYEFLNSAKFDLGDQEKTYFTYSGLMRAIDREKPDTIIVNGFSIVTIRLWIRSFFRKTDYIIWSGSIHKKGRNDSPLRLKIRKLLIQRARSFIVYGSKAKEYLMRLGAHESEIFVAINTVDTNFFTSRTNFLKGSKRKVDNKKHLTYVGYLSSRKNVKVLLESVSRLVKERNDFILDIVGDGDDKPGLESYVRENKLEEIVKFHGFVQKEQLPDFFATSDCFLFQTDFDIWGLVLNEAMAAGLPVISSPNAGATFDLISEGITGFQIDFSEKEKVIEKINWILNNPQQAQEIGMNASRYIKEHASIEISARGIMNAVTHS